VSVCSTYSSERKNAAPIGSFFQQPVKASNAHPNPLDLSGTVDLGEGLEI